MIKFIDDFLNGITMYRLMLYYLICLVGIAVILSLFGLLPFSPFSLIFSSLFLVILSWAANTLFAAIFRASTNIESAYISALILSLIVTPINFPSQLLFLFLLAVFAMASKYILAINKKHLFNPSALSVALTAVALGKGASWWIGTSSMTPFVVLGGLLILRKIQRFSLAISFTLIALAGILFSGSLTLIVNSPLIFFACVMLVEPLTTPSTRKLQIFYGGLVGLLFLRMTPETALLLGNIFSYLVSPREKLILKLKEKKKLSPQIYEFIFPLPHRLNFVPGQYMEWTLSHPHSDARGNRRYFTLACSPTEKELHIGVKFEEQSSSFKKVLLVLDNNKEIVASQLTGDFVLPTDQDQKLVFLAGGIGITPFRSMIKFLLDTGQKRTIALFYANKNVSEIVYQDIFDRAQELGLKTIYTLTDKEHLPDGWTGKMGRVTPEMVKEEVPDFRERIFYLSGPHAMVISFEEMLKNLGIPGRQIRVDFFPGYV